MGVLQKMWWSLSRRKQIGGDEKQKLKRALSLLDLVALGVGSTLGLGVYVLAGSVAKTIAGPGVCLSFLVAAFASALAGICYSEFASRVPEAGSAYVYSYVSVGEFIAFTIGWNLILEYVIGTASVAKGMSNYLDALCGNVFSEYLSKVMPLEIEHLSNYPDFLAFFLVAIITVLLAVGVKESTRLNDIFTALNMITIIVVIISGATKADPANWKIDVDTLDDKWKAIAGVGGFLPFGFTGVMRGAARCFFGFVGFDCVATTGEEAINPRKNIPLSIVISLLTIFLSYFSIAIVITMMIPYYLMDSEAPFPHAFQMVDLPVIAYVVSAGACCALCTSLLGAMFPLPRIVYAMSSDGLLPRVLARVNAKSMTPIIATIFTGFFSAIMASLFNLEQLIDMMSIGTLMAYSIVAISILILRYEQQDFELKNEESIVSIWQSFINIFNLHSKKVSDKSSSLIADIFIAVFIVLSVLLCSTAEWWDDDSEWKIGLISILVILILISTAVLCRQPQHSTKDLSFKVPLVPLLPCISVLMNLYLMVKLDGQTWIRFIIWLFIGYLIYFFYGIFKSNERTRKNDVAVKTKM